MRESLSNRAPQFFLFNGDPHNFLVLSEQKQLCITEQTRRTDYWHSQDTTERCQGDGRGKLESSDTQDTA